MALTQVQGIRASIFCGSNDPTKSTKFRTPYPYSIPIVIKNSYSDSIGSHCDGGDVCTYYKTCTRVSPGNLNISQLLEINRDTTGFYFTSTNGDTKEQKHYLYAIVVHYVNTHARAT